VLGLVSLSLALAGPAQGQAILNVERLLTNETMGRHATVSARFNLAKGNTDVVQVGGDLGGEHLTEKHWFRAFAGLEQLKKGGEEVLDNRYLHFRYNYRFSPALRTFHFVQLQTNQNLLLRRRWLLGTGLRCRILHGPVVRLDVGSGLMLEDKRLERGTLDPGERDSPRNLRLANLLATSGLVGEENRWIAVVYFQPEIGRLEDHRVLGEVGWSSSLSRHLDLEFGLSWRHDSKPPAHLKQDDLSLKTGITLRLG